MKIYNTMTRKKEEYRKRKTYMCVRHPEKIS